MSANNGRVSLVVIIEKLGVSPESDLHGRSAICLRWHVGPGPSRPRRQSRQTEIAFNGKEKNGYS